MSFLTTLHQLMNRIEYPHQAEAVLSVLVSYGSEHEKQQLKPLMLTLRRRLLSNTEWCIISQLKIVLEGYCQEHGNLSDELIHFIEKGLTLTSSTLARHTFSR